MKISWQGNLTETNAATVAEFLEREGVDASGAVVEWNERMFAPGDDLRDVALEDGGTLSAFKVVAGG